MGDEASTILGVFRRVGDDVVPVSVAYWRAVACDEGLMLSLAPIHSRDADEPDEAVTLLVSDPEMPVRELFAQLGASGSRIARETCGLLPVAARCGCAGPEPCGEGCVPAVAH